jgi:hypothetical protein
VELNHDLARQIGELAERLVTVQVFMAGGGSVFAQRPVVVQLYDAARAGQPNALCYNAAAALAERLAPGQPVLITTGFFVAPWMAQEADGPIGTATLARALALGFRAVPIVVTEAVNVAGTQQICRAVGLDVTTPDRARAAPHKVAVLPFPLDEARAAGAARQLLADLQPGAVVAIEKPARNRHGVYHNGAGYDVSPLVAKVDHLVDQARALGIPTIGIGDGGNEIGMGRIADAVRAAVPTGARCRCPCAGGNAAATATDHLVVGAVANWGAYALEACLAALLERPELLHDATLERQLLAASISAGLVDPASGLAEGWMEAMPGETSVAVVTLLRAMLDLRLHTTWRIDAYRAWAQRPEEVQAAIAAWGQRLAAEEPSDYR